MEAIRRFWRRVAGPCSLCGLTGLFHTCYVRFSEQEPERWAANQPVPVRRGEVKRGQQVH